MAEKGQRQGLSDSFIDVFIAYVPRRRAVLYCGAFVYELGLFCGNDYHHPRNFGIFDGVFVRAYTFYNLVGNFNMDSARRARCVIVLAGVQIFRQDRRIYKNQIQNQEKKEMTLSRLFLIEYFFIYLI